MYFDQFVHQIFLNSYLCRHVLSQCHQSSSAAFSEWLPKQGCNYCTLQGDCTMTNITDHCTLCTDCSLNIVHCTTTAHGTLSLITKNLPKPGEGPQLEGLTRIMGWEKKGIKHFYTWLRAGELTKDSEDQINTTLGTMQSLHFFRGIYKNTSKINCNPPQKFQEQMATMHRQALNYIVSKDKKNNVLPGCTFCTIGITN